MQVVADHLVTTSGIRPLLHSFAVDVIMEEDTIKGIIMESKSGRRAILAERIIDCTGDADIAHLAGAEYRVTDKKESPLKVKFCLKVFTHAYWSKAYSL